MTALFILGTAAALAAPKDKNKRGDVIWVHPRFDSLKVQSIAFIPVASFDNNFQNEKIVERHLGAALQGSGYRWISPATTKSMLTSAMGEAGLAAIDKSILTIGRVDSSSASRLCRALRVTAVLSARLDLFEQVQVEWNQSGKPSTTIQAHAAVVDSSGRLVWSASGSETAEGPYHDANAATLGVKGSSLNTEPITGQGGAPSFDDVTTRLFTRWATQFPAYARVEAQATPPANAPAATPAAPATPDK
jgi:hypothetical protein